MGQLLLRALFLNSCRTDPNDFHVRMLFGVSPDCERDLKLPVTVGGEISASVDSTSLPAPPLAGVTGDRVILSNGDCVTTSSDCDRKRRLAVRGVCASSMLTGARL